jgi:hypothetical protein
MMSMHTAEAVAHAELILTRHARITMKRSDVAASLTLWSVESIRVAEVDVHTLDNRAGSAYMQSDLPYGLAACASVERWLVALTVGDPELVRDERANASYILTGRAA